MSSSALMLEVGYIVGAHGIRGDLRIEMHDRQSTALRAGVVVTIVGREPTKVDRRYEVRQAAAVPGHPGRFRVSLEGVTDRTVAESLRGGVVAMSRDELPTIDDNEFYLADAIGLPAVRDRAGTIQHLGTIAGVMSNGAQDLFEISWTAEGQEQTWLIPVLPGFVLAIEDGKVWVDPPEGMLPEALEEGS